MSGIAGIIHFDGAPIEPGLIEKMTSAMAHRGPDGIHHWTRGSVALGHCMLQTTPESLEETQPLANEDASLVLVMDGRVDNWVELRRELLGRGAVLRTRADAELLLRAYEVWGEDCPDRIIGEYAFFVWDARQKRLFAARDAAGTRHFYYHAGKNWFAFASEIKGLLALDDIEPKLNESRVLDYLVPAFDRDDVVGTFYLGIEKMPAGHVMTVTALNVHTRRWWDPSALPARRFASLDECAEAFREQLANAVKCRLRSIGPVGAMLSGGLDSSSIVALIGSDFRGELREPLRTFSLVREDRQNCADWQSVQHMLSEDWLSPTLLSSASVDDVLSGCLERTGFLDEPFAMSHGLTYQVIYQAASERGCRVVLDGIAGDLLFYGPERSFAAILEGRQFAHIPGVLRACSRHAVGSGPRKLFRAAASHAAPEAFKALVRGRRDKNALEQDDLGLLVKGVAPRLIYERRSRQTRDRPANDQAKHAGNFTRGTLSFAHEVYGEIAFSSGVEPRSPFSDRRVIEFAITMPLAAKLTKEWYKPTLRKAMQDNLPGPVLHRKTLGAHPGWKFYQRLIEKSGPDTWFRPARTEPLRRWVNVPTLEEDAVRFEHGCYTSGIRAFRSFALLKWLEAKEGVVC
jgi:asparagine synthase (glutamine-hydrolysing)